MLQPSEQNELLALLSWYGEMGVDSVIADEPVDWLARGETAPGAPVRAALRAASAAAFAPGGGPGTGTGVGTNPAGGPSVSGASGVPAARAPVLETPSGAPPGAPARAPRRQHSPPRAPVAAPQSRRFPTKGPDEAVVSATKLAGQATTLAQLQDIVSAFDGCGLKATAKNLCFYRGADRARLMVIGDAPGRDEDLAGQPFVGRDGALLDKMLSAINLDDSQCHITNIVYWRPPGNRPPTGQEAQICRPFLQRQIELVAPQVILLLGGTAAKSFLNVSDGIMRLRGKWRDLPMAGASSSASSSTSGGANTVAQSQSSGNAELETQPATDAARSAVKILATLHPAYLIRTPAAKRLAWRDLLMIKTMLKKQG